MHERILRVLSIVVTVLLAANLLAACPEEDPPATGDTLEVIADVAQEADGGAETTAPECTTDSECTSPGPCVAAACVAGTCQQSNRIDGTDCSTSATCTATCAAGVCGATTPVPACGSKQCGTDGCGTSCGSCAAGSTCDAATGICSSGDPCNGITFDGCCTAAGVATWCGEDAQGNPTLQTYDCGGNESPAHWCGWTGNLGYYCTDTVSSDPGGLSLLCPDETCTQACSDVECGWLCGEDCGACDAGSFCDANNACVACEPTDCGGGCGGCDEGSICDYGTCVVDTCALGDVGQGCCSGNVVAWCDDGSPEASDCGAEGCGWDTTNGYYECGFSGEDPTGTYPLECGTPTVAEPGPEGAEVVEAVETVEGPVEAVEAVEVPVDSGPSDAAAETVETTDSSAGDADAGTTDVTAPDADADASTPDVSSGDVDASTSDVSAGDADVSSGGFRDGVYTGTITVDMLDIGFVTNSDSCTADLVLTIDESASPQVTGVTTCHPAGILAGQDLVLTFEGDIIVDPTQVDGTVLVDWNAMFMPTDVWNGSFTGADTLDGSFAGNVTQGSAGFDWTATFTVVR